MLSVRQLVRSLAWFAGLQAVACGGDGEPTVLPEPLPDGGSERCPPGELELEDGRCLAAGWQDDGCAAGQFFDGTDCREPGVPPERCGEGFAPAPDGGCEPVLPSAPCDAGELAGLGESSCRPVAPCGAGPWGELPPAAGIEYVDPTYGGTDSDGSAARPWTTMAAGVAAAGAGDIVALAAGSYAEPLVLEDRPVRLWGRCPGLVELVGTSADGAVVRLAGAASGSELHDLAVRGPGRGVDVAGGAAVVIERVWVHELGGYGLSVLTHSSVELRDSLLEGATERGVFVEGGAAQVTRSTVRDTVGGGVDGSGRGINVRDDLASGTRGELALERSVVERSVGTGLLVHCSDATVTDSVVRDTRLTAAGRFGRGVLVQAQTSECEPSIVAVRGSVVERSHDAGIFVAGCRATLERVSVRDTASTEDELAHACGVYVQHDPSSGAAGELELRESSIAGNHESGLLVISSTAWIEAVRVSDSQPNDAGLFGRGITVASDSSVSELAELVLRGSLVEASHDAGIVVDSAVVSIEGTAVRDGQPRLADGAFGRGITIQAVLKPGAAPEATLRSCSVEQSYEVGLWLQGVQATVQATAIRDTRSRLSDGWLGLGLELAASSVGPRASLSLAGSIIETSHATGVAVGGADATIDRTLVSDTGAEEGTDLFGDGLTVLRYGTDEGNATVTRSRIASSARAGLVSFGASATLGGLRLDCNRLGLVAEVFEDGVPTLQDAGDVRCGCGANHDVCAVVSAGLEPPSPLGTSE